MLFANANEVGGGSNSGHPKCEDGQVLPQLPDSLIIFRLIVTSPSIEEMMALDSLGSHAEEFHPLI